jgi:hypothetical protein
MADSESNAEGSQDVAATRSDKVVIKQEQDMEDSESARPNGDMTDGDGEHAHSNGRAIKTEESESKGDVHMKEEQVDVKQESKSAETTDSKDSVRVKEEKEEGKSEDKDQKTEKSSSTKDKEKDKRGKPSRYSVSRLQSFSITRASVRPRYLSRRAAH